MDVTMDLSSQTIQRLIVLIPLLPLLGAFFNGIAGPRFPRSGVAWVGCSCVMASMAASVGVLGALLSKPPGWAFHSTLWTWMDLGSITVPIRLTVDALSGTMICLVTGIGLLIHIYSLGYMNHEPALSRYFSYLNLFTAAMLLLVLADSLPVMFVGWEGVGLCSYLLIGFGYTDRDKAAAGKKAFIVNRIADVGFVVAMLVLMRWGGDVSFEGLQRAAAGGHISETVAYASGLLVLLAACGKSAQGPLYLWLPSAMAGPTPVSALMHAATMVTAGIYLLARMGFLLNVTPEVMLMTAWLGALTSVVAGGSASVQYDIKKILAYSTISQLGLMMMAVGVGAYAMALFHVITHAFFKACLFLGAGSVIHSLDGEQDIRTMGGLGRKLPITCGTFGIASLAIAGFPLMSGFVSKDAIVYHTFTAELGWGGSGWGSPAYGLGLMGLLSAGLTAFYMGRVAVLTFFSGPPRASAFKIARVSESPLSMTGPLIILAALSVMGGALGWPHSLGGHVWIATWLAPVLGRPPASTHASSSALEWTLMGVSTLMTLGGMGLAWKLYAAGPMSWIQHTVQRWRWYGLYTRLFHGWHGEDLYHATVVQPWMWLSRVILYQGLERRLIDASVHRLGWLARSLGFWGQLFQSGHIQRYLAIFAIGMAVVLYGWLTPRSEPPEIHHAIVRPSSFSEHRQPRQPLSTGGQATGGQATGGQATGGQATGGQDHRP